MKIIEFSSRFIFMLCKRGAALLLVGIVLLSIGACVSFAAVGCTLNDPDRDVKRLFPASTGYRTSFVSIKEVGGLELYHKVEQDLGDKLDGVYETVDVPYSFYEVLKGKDVIAHIHGVNQKGTYGGMQLIIATDPTGKIVAFYYQKMSSPEAKKFMDKSFTAQFIGLTLKDFIAGKIAVKDPSASSHEDFKATLRGLKKNLILLEVLKLHPTVA